MDGVNYTYRAGCIRYLLAPARVDGVYRDDYDLAHFGEVLATRLEERQYNLFFATDTVADSLPYAGRTDDAGAPLETGVVYTLQNDFPAPGTGCLNGCGAVYKATVSERSKTIMESEKYKHIQLEKGMWGAMCCCRATRSAPI